MVSTQWEIAECDAQHAGRMAEALGVPRLVAILMMARGICDADQARAFLRPLSLPLEDPFQLQDMAEAVARIEQAARDEERVLVFGDYDVDGISGTAILLRALKRFGVADVLYDMPSRIEEGYGLNARRIAQARQEGVNLIVTVDNGINAREAGEAAAEAGIDLIVTDHHQLEGEMPLAVAVVNPKRGDQSAPLYDLCGAGVAFKLACALTGVEEDLDLVALGTVADIVPLHGENRVLVARGLQYMARYPRLGLDALLKKTGLNRREVTAENIAFMIGPRINAVGRLGDGLTAVNLLVSESEGEALQLAQRLDHANDERKQVEQEMLKDAEAELEATFVPSQSSIVLARRGWHPGVIGIVAARLHNTYNRPVALISLNENGVGRGSARSTPEFDIAEVLAGCADLMERFGGHRAAGGMTLPEENIPAFKEHIEEEAGRRLPEGGQSRMLTIDALVALSEIEPRMLETLDILEPFGHGNPFPLLCSCSVSLLQDSLKVLQHRHLRVALRQGARTFSAIGFDLADRAGDIAMCRRVDIAFRPRFNTYRGETEIQLVLKDIRPARKSSH